MSTVKPILYKERSYNIMAVLFTVHNELGHSFQEKHYQKAVEQCLIERRISYKKELKANLTFRGSSLGLYYLDFLIDEKIVVELKAKPAIEPQDIRQVMSYLRTTNLKLGIIANFRTQRLTYKRVINLAGADIREYS